MWEETRGGAAQESLPKRRARVARQRALSDPEVAVAEAEAAAAAAAMAGEGDDTPPRHPADPRG